MRIYGVDFTSAPQRRRPITCAVCELRDAQLSLDCFVALDSFEVFENLLASDGPWVGAFDFPFGLPRPLVAALGWPLDWAGCVAAVGRLSLAQFEARLTAYREDRPPGEKHPLRGTDRAAGAASAANLVRPPVAKMFHAGAPRLLASGANVVPCRPNGEWRIALEAYPALVARHLVGRHPYKRDDDAAAAVRRELVAGLGGDALAARYGLRAALPQAIREDLASDPGGDNLDALLAAVQGAWSYASRDADFGVPDGCDRLEGWIVDPGVALPA